MSGIAELRRREEASYTRQNPGSLALYRRALEALPGGSTRTLTYFAPFPLYASRGKGGRLWDVDGNVRIDLFNNATALIHGHARPEVVRAIHDVAGQGTAFASATEWEIRLAEILIERVPSVERVRFCNSGTEANMMAVRAMRAFTERPKVAKFEGGYHGSSDDLNVSVHPSPEAGGPRRSPRPVPDSEGITPDVIGTIVVLPFNDLEAVADTLRPLRGEVAGILVEPVLGSAGMISPRPGFLPGLQDLARELGILLAFDEVMMFRLSRDGAQGFFGVTPDLTSFGKIIGGGLPVGALGGRADVMALFDPRRERTRIPHAGTFNGNPATMAAGVATMELLDEAAFKQMASLGEFLRRNLREAVSAARIPAGVTGEASLFKVHFTAEEIVDYRSARTSNRDLERLMFLYALNLGVFINGLARGCLSTATTQGDVERFLDVAEAFFRDIAGGV
jgi:glutamate-1-semialdehyde 2,1-aminomutase